VPHAAPVAGLLAEGLAAAALLAVAVLCVAWVSMRRRLRQLNAALRSVAAGDLESALPAPGPGVIGELTEGIGAMTDTLRSNYDELKTNDELRRRLIANVSHELRTPLTNIQGYLESARLAGPQSPDYGKHLEVSLRETRKLTRLVQDLFELSKLDTRKLEFHFETVSLTELADQVGLAFEQRMADKQIRFAMDFPDDPLEVRGDGNRLGQVIQNLLGNAAVFTEPGGKVTLSCERKAGKAVISVADTGVGIAEKDLPHIFESFFHLEKSQSRNLGGTGLGLAICKAIVDAHKGAISVTSRVGKGTTFRVELALSGAD
jgi:two-component system phosphate regulon sensor histidine kinase PhoR